MQLSIIGFDISKKVFQVHGIDAAGEIVTRKKLRRGEVMRYFADLLPCVVGIEACGSAHHWARELTALGHEVRMIAPSYVKPYVKRGKKNDATDAEAICEAVQRPGMRFVSIKSAEQQGIMMLHRSRDLLIRQRTMLVNALRGHMAELGIVAPKGIWNAKALMEAAADNTERRIPASARPALRMLVHQIAALGQPIRELDRAILESHKASEDSRRLTTIPGFGAIVASACRATAGDMRQFRSGRHFAAWLGLVPGQHSTAGKDKLGPITKMGDRYLRKLLVIGATARLCAARRSAAPDDAWIRRLLERKPARLVTVAIANKMARTAWALTVRGEVYQPRASAA